MVSLLMNVIIKAVSRQYVWCKYKIARPQRCLGVLVNNFANHMLLLQKHAHVMYTFLLSCKNLKIL